MEEKQEPTADQTPEPNPFAKIQQQAADSWNTVADGARAQIAKVRGLFPDPSVQPTVEELRAAVELPGDTMRYVKLAANRHGLPSWPKAQRGRKKPHMTKHSQAIKSASLTIFRGLFVKHITELEAKAKAAGETFNGVPNDDLPKLGAKAAVIGAKQIEKRLAAERRQARNRQKLSRRINRGVVPGNTNVLAYITN